LSTTPPPPPPTLHSPLIRLCPSISMHEMQECQGHFAHGSQELIRHHKESARSSTTSRCSKTTECVVFYCQPRDKWILERGKEGAVFHSF
jgi:hypothetical protein